MRRLAYTEENSTTLTIPSDPAITKIPRESLRFLRTFYILLVYTIRKKPCLPKKQPFEKNINLALTRI